MNIDVFDTSEAWEKMRSEGWFLSRSVIYCSTFNAIFLTVDEAFEFVATKAKEGSEFHKAAIAKVVARRMS